MEFQHVNVKIPLDAADDFDPTPCIEIFHQWIREGRLPDLLVDVADYRHVPDGPGVLLVGLEADYGMDHTDGCWGLRYNRKAAREGSNADRIRDALQSALRAALLIEKDFADRSAVTFKRNELEMFINDRALAPNTRETYEMARPELESVLTAILGPGTINMLYPDEPRRRFGVTYRTDAPFDPSRVAAGAASPS